MKFLLTKDHMGWKFQNATLLQFSSDVSQTLYYGDIGYLGGLQAITFLGKFLKKFVALWNFNMGVDGKT